ncbi:cytochrome c3 family protein [Neobacillus notoginsengisoli]|uniref:cytochrome c3 family protein n=1 Tax=Neobacillus notoginsengisoli TaxID=1578198 RepID=UPI001EFFEDBD|nr:NapC/NirT family cytochrome c [Neobacillus notoginsengisoli]
MLFRRKKKPPETETHPKEKKKSLWRRVKEIDWKNPVNRWKLLFATLALLIVGGGGFGGVLAFTNSPTFCKSCHEMQPEFATFEASAHSQISCVQCHIQPGAVNMLTHKMKSMKEVYYHLTGIPEQIVQTPGEAIPNISCQQCHTTNRLVTASGDLMVNHKKHIDEGIPCITCHAGVAHGKIADRKLNTEKDRHLWTADNAEKLMTKEYMDPNMGTCIDCHDKVNKGQKPWEDVAYSLPRQVEHGSSKVETADANKAENTGKSQQIILQAIGMQHEDVKLSMECSTCHKEVDTPATHKRDKWKVQHGETAYKNVDQCVNCHKDTKWAKEVQPQNIQTLINHSEGKEQHSRSPEEKRSTLRTNEFCNACHGERPPSHGDSDDWLTKHAKKASTKPEKETCFTCHDKQKPQPESTTAKPPTDIYCQYCHRTGFKGE